MECLLLHLLSIAGLLLIYRVASRDENVMVARYVLYAWIAFFLVISFWNVSYEICGWWPPNCPRVEQELVQRLVAVGGVACNFHSLLASRRPLTDHLLQEPRQRQRRRASMRERRQQPERGSRLRCCCRARALLPQQSGSDADTEDLHGAGIYARYENRSRSAAQDDASQPGAERVALSGDRLPINNRCCHTEHQFDHPHHPEAHQGAVLSPVSRVIYHWHKGKMVETIISRRPESSPGFRIQNPTGLKGQHKGGNADVTSDEVHRNKSQSIEHTGESGDLSRKTSVQDVQNSGNDSAVQLLDTDHRTKNGLPEEHPESELSPIISGSHHQEKGKKVDTTVSDDSCMPVSGSSSNGRQKLVRAAVLLGQRKYTDDDAGRGKKLRGNVDIIDGRTETKEAGTHQLKPLNSDAVMQAADTEYKTDRQAETHLDAESSHVINAINNFVKREELEAIVHQEDNVPSLKTGHKVFDKKILTGFSSLHERGTADVASDEVSQNKSRLYVDTDGREDPHNGGSTKQCKATSLTSEDITLDEIGQILASDAATSNSAEAKADSSVLQSRIWQPKFDYPSELADQNKITGKQRPRRVLNFDETTGMGFYLPKLPKGSSVNGGPVRQNVETKNSAEEYPPSSVGDVSKKRPIASLQARKVKKTKQDTAPADGFGCTLPHSGASVGAAANIRVSRGTFSASKELRAIKRLSGEPKMLLSQSCERSGGSSDSVVTTHEDTVIWAGATCSEDVSTQTTGTPNTVVNTFTELTKTDKGDTSKIRISRSGKQCFHVRTSPHGSNSRRASVASKSRTQVASGVQRQLEIIFGNKIRKPCEKCGGQTRRAGAGNGESVNTRSRAVYVPVEPAVQKNNSTLSGAVNVPVEPAVQQKDSTRSRAVNVPVEPVVQQNNSTLSGAVYVPVEPAVQQKDSTRSRAVDVPVEPAVQKNNSTLTGAVNVPVEPVVQQKDSTRSRAVNVPVEPAVQQNNSTRSGVVYINVKPAVGQNNSTLSGAVYVPVEPPVRQYNSTLSGAVYVPVEPAVKQDNSTRSRAVYGPVDVAVQQNNSTEAAKSRKVMLFSKIPVESNSASSPPEWRLVPLISEVPAPAKQARSSAAARTPPPSDSEKNTKSRSQLPDNGSQKTQQPPPRARRSLRLVLTRVNSTSGQDADGAGHCK